MLLCGCFAFALHRILGHVTVYIKSHHTLPICFWFTQYWSDNTRFLP